MSNAGSTGSGGQKEVKLDAPKLDKIKLLWKVYANLKGAFLPVTLAICVGASMPHRLFAVSNTDVLPCS